MCSDEIFNALKEKKEIKILFVCLGNICRSPAAQGMFESIVGDNGRFKCDSAGLYHGHRGELPDYRMREHARRRGLELTHRARPVVESDFDEFDLIIGMDGANLDNLRRMAPTLEAERKIVPMIDFVADNRGYDHIPDPYYEGAEGFELVLDLLTDGCGELYKRLS